MSTKIGDLIVQIGADVSGLKSAMKDAENSLDVLKNKTEKASLTTSALGKGVLLGGVAFTALSKGIEMGVSGLQSIIHEATNAQLIQAQLGSVLKSTGEAAGMTNKQINEYAKTLAGTTLFTQDAIVGGLNHLLTYTGVQGEMFKKASAAALDMSQALGMDLNQAAEKVGNSLQYPTAALNSLTKQGFRFTEQQTKQIKEFEKAGKMAEAQQIILDELNLAYGGSAEAAGNTFSGAIKRAREAVKDLGGEIGKGLMPSITNLIGKGDGWGSKIIDWANKNNNLARAAYQVSEAIIAAGFVIAGLGTGIASLALPLVATANTVIAFAKDVIYAFQNIQLVAGGVVEGIKQALSGDFSGAANTFKNTMAFTFSQTATSMQVNAAVGKQYVDTMMGMFNQAGNHIKNSMTGAGFSIQDFSQKTPPYLEKVEGALNKNGKSFAEFVQKIKDQFNDLDDKIKDAFSKQESRLKKNESEWKSYKNSIESQLKSIKKEHKSTVESIKEQTDDLNKSFAKSQNQDLGSFKDQIGQMLVSHEDKAKAIQDQITAEMEKQQVMSYAGNIWVGPSQADTKKLDDLKASLAEEQRLIAEAQKYSTQYGVDIEQARNVAHMSEIERAAYEYEQRKKIAQLEHDEKISELNKTLAEENSSYTAHYNKLNAKLTSHKKKYEDTMNSIKKKTKDTLKDIRDEFIKTFSNISDTSHLLAAFKNIEKAKGKIDFNQFAKDIGFNISGSRQLGGPIYETGLYMMHSGEQVIPAHAADAMRQGGSSKNINVSFNNISVRNDGDLDYFVNAVKQTLSRDYELASYGNY